MRICAAQRELFRAYGELLVAPGYGRVPHADCLSHYIQHYSGAYE